MKTTFFYVFANEKYFNSNTITDKNRKTIKSSGGLDEKLLEAFQELEYEYNYEQDVKIVYNPSDYNKIRNIFDISKLPAFGISDIDVKSDKINEDDKLTRLPHRLNIFKRKKRKEMLETSKYFPKVERDILEHFTDTEKIFFFIRDLYISNIDSNLNQVINLINKKANEILGKKATTIIGETKRKLMN